MTYNHVDLMSVLLEPFGPGDPEVVSTAKYKLEEYHNLFKKIKKQPAGEFNNLEKDIVMDSFRMFLEGVSEVDVMATTGKTKEYFLNLFRDLTKEWNISMSKLKRLSYDSTEYQKKATASGLVEA